MSDVGWTLGAMMGSVLLLSCEGEQPVASKHVEAEVVEDPPRPARAEAHPQPAPSPEPAPTTTVETDGMLQIVMAEVPDVTQLQLTRRHYYVTTARSRLFRADRSSGEQTQIDDVSGLQLAVDGDALYYSAMEGLSRVEHESSVPSQIVTTGEVEGIDGVLDFTLDDEFVYFAPFQAPGIFRVPKVGGEVEKLSDQQRPGSLALTGTHLYFASFFRNRIGRVAKSGGRVETLWSSAGGPVALAIDEPMAVALLETTESVVSIDLPSKKRRDLAETGPNPTRLVLWNGHAYWSTGKLAPDDPTVIQSVATTGGPTETLVSDQGLLILLAVEDGWLYFSPIRESSIVRLALSGRD